MSSNKSTDSLINYLVMLNELVPHAFWIKPLALKLCTWSECGNATAIADGAMRHGHHSAADRGAALVARRSALVETPVAHAARRPGLHTRGPAAIVANGNRTVAQMRAAAVSAIGNRAVTRMQVRLWCPLSPSLQRIQRLSSRWP